MSISNIFIPNFVCVLTNERYKTYLTGFLFCRLGHAPGVGLWGTGFFFKHGHVAYQIDGDDKQNIMQVTFLSQGQTGDLGGEVKRSNIINMSIYKIFYTKLCVCSHK